MELSDQPDSDSNTQDQQKGKRIQVEIGYCRQKIELLLNGEQTEAQRLEAMRQLSMDWHELKKHYESLVQEGFSPSEAFQNAAIAANHVFDSIGKESSISRELQETYLQQMNLYLDGLELNFVKKDPKRPFLVNLWTWTLQKLEMLSLFYIIRNLVWPDYTKRNFRFVDAWLLGHTLLALFYVFIANIEVVPLAVKYILLVYGCLRMFEVLIYQLNVILVHPYNATNYSLNSYRRMTIALIHNFIEIIFWFAGTFITLQFITDSTVPLALYTSFTHMVTYSMNLDDAKWTMLAIFILQFQAAIGVFMTVLSLARFVSLFPQPASQDPAEQEANEVRHAKLIEEITYLKATVESNSARILDNKREIDQIHEKETSTDEVARTGGKA